MHQSGLASKTTIRTITAFTALSILFALGLASGGCSGENKADDALGEPNGQTALAVKTGTSPCTNPPTNTDFCDDFDNDEFVDTMWSTTASSGKGRGKLGTSLFVSPPASYRLHGQYDQEVDLPGVYNPTLSYEMDVRIHQVAAVTMQDVRIGTLDFSLFLDDSGKLHCGQTNQGTGGDFAAPSPVSLDEWHHIRIDIDASKVKLSIDGTLVRNEPNAVGLPGGSQLRQLTLGAEDGGGLIANFDNVILRDPSPESEDAGSPDSGTVDSGPQDSGVADSGSTDSGVVDAGPAWVVLVCNVYHSAGGTDGVWINSDGSYHMASFVPFAGSLDNGLGEGTLGTPLTATQLAAVIAAAQTMNTSVAGYTTTTNSFGTQMLNSGRLTSAGAPNEAATLVDSFTENLGTETIVHSNDAAAATLNAYCPFAVNGT